MSAITKVFGILKTIIAHHWCGLACFEVVTKTRAPKPTAHPTKLRRDTSCEASSPTVAMCLPPHPARATS